MRASSLTWTLLTSTVIFPGLSTGLSAQNPDRVAVPSERLEHLGAGSAEFSPHSGPPGTVVRLHVRDLPPLAPLRVGIGALHMGFEEAGWVLSSDDGEFSTDVTIPEWGRNDAVHLFIVFDPYFNPIALTDVFHVTAEDGTIVRSGVVGPSTGQCITLRGLDGIDYGLVGNGVALARGDSVRVQGTISSDSNCSQNVVIDMVTHEPLRSDRHSSR